MKKGCRGDVQAWRGSKGVLRRRKRGRGLDEGDALCGIVRESGNLVILRRDVGKPELLFVVVQLDYCWGLW